jgi:hypothetical protein
MVYINTADNHYRYQIMNSTKSVYSTYNYKYIFGLCVGVIGLGATFYYYNNRKQPPCDSITHEFVDAVDDVDAAEHIDLEEYIDLEEPLQQEYNYHCELRSDPDTQANQLLNYLKSLDSDISDIDSSDIITPRASYMRVVRKSVGSEISDDPYDGVAGYNAQTSIPLFMMTIMTMPFL